MDFPIEQVRQCFPALARTQNGRLVAYFDGPGGTQVPQAVIDAVVEYLARHNANTHWRFPSSRETDDLIAGARAAAADLLGATPDEVAFGANMTTLTFHLARALGRGWREGDELVVTELDHHANVAPWREVARERGLVVRQVPMVPATGELDWDALERALTPRVRLLAIGAASNALGTVNDVARAAELAQRVGALVFVDAVHFVPHVPTDVRAVGCDFLGCSAYKFYGPHVGLLYGRRELVRELDVPKLQPAPDDPPERLETGTQNHEGIAGVAAAVEFLASLGGPPTADRRTRLRAAYRALHARGQRLVERLWDGLGSIPGVRLYGPAPDRPRTPTVAFTVAGVASGDVAEALAGEGVFVSHGDFYATTVIERYGLGPEGAVRAGCACYTTEEEIDRLVDGVRRLSGAR